MATLGWLKLGTAVDLGPLQKGAHNAAGYVKELRDHIVGVLAAVGAFEAVRGLKDYVSSTIEAVSQSKLLAEKVGFGVEGFQKLSYAAKFAHMTQEDLATSLGQMSRRLGEVAIEGAGPAADALKRFGLSAQVLASMGPEKAFSVLVGVMERIQNPMERSKVAMDLFGKSGQGMVNLVARGGPELKAMGDEAARLGFALNAVDVAKTVEAEEAMIKLSAASTGFANLLVTQLAPYITLVIEKYTEWAYSSAKTSNFISTGMGIVQTSIGFVLDAVNILGAGFYGFRSIVDSVIEANVHGFELLLSGIQAVLNGVAAIAGTVSSSAQAAIENISKNIGEFKGGVTLFREEMQKAAQVDLGKSIEDFNKIGKGGETIKKLMDDIQNAATDRAKEAAKKSAQFIDPNAITPKHQDTKFATAAESGTKEAYSAILASKGMQSNAQQNIAINTKTTADAAVASLSVLGAISATLTAQGAGKGNIPATMGKI